MNIVPQRLLISRTDNMGDVILTLPMATLLKQKYPHLHITFLARDYVRAIIASCPDVDAFLSWDELTTLPTKSAKKRLRSLNVDTALHVFPRAKIAKLIKQAKIKHRIGTNRRWYHYVTCNHRLANSRAKSNKHEAQLNLQLLAFFDIATDHTLNEIAPLARLFPKKLPEELRHFIHPHKFNLIIHPLSNGNSREWPLENFQTLIQRLPQEQYHFLITGSAHEKKTLKDLIRQCPHAIDLTGKLDLSQLLQLVAACDGLVANSTGPLHLAASLGIKTLGLYPPVATMNPQRWQPLGKQAQYLVNPEPCKATCENNTCACMRAISVQQVQKALLQWVTTTIAPSI